MRKICICIILLSILSSTQCFSPTKQPGMMTSVPSGINKSMGMTKSQRDKVAETSENPNGLARYASSTQRRKYVKQDFPPEVYNMDKVPDDSKTPFVFPELKVTEYLKSSRLVLGRSYARKESFVSVDKEFKPTVQDLSSPPSTFIDRFLISSWYRLAVFGLTWQIYPYINDFLIDKGDL